MKLKYSVIIQWSEADNCYIASLPEWGPQAHTHGDTYEEAARNAQEALELLADGEQSPPAPHLFTYPEGDNTGTTSVVRASI